MTITIDARQCGGGKTTHPLNGIYAKINKNLSANTKTIVVLGSKALQYQYRKKFNSMTIINDECSNESVIKDITNAMKNDAGLLGITHQAFMLLEYTDIRSQYDLIIDEAISGLIEEHKISLTSNKFVDFKWTKHFELNYQPTDIPFEKLLEQFEAFKQEEISKLDDKEEIEKLNNLKMKFDREEFYSVCFKGGEDHNTMLSDLYRKLTSRNRDYYTSLYDYNIMLGNDTRQKTFNMYSVFNSRLFTGWKSIHIAAAAFHKTQLYHIFKYNNIEFTYIQKFAKHKGNIKLHIVSNTYNVNGKYKSMSWSNYKRTKHPEILQSYHNYVNGITNGNKVLSLRNLSEKTTLANEIKLGHSVHGINNEEWQQVTNVSMESALRPSNQLISFIKRVVLDQSLADNQMDLIITDMFCSYLFYQAIMRCKLRSLEYVQLANSNQYNSLDVINIFTLDNNVALNLYDYFEIIIDEVQTFEVEWNRPKPLTSTERSIAHRENKKSESQGTKLDNEPPIDKSEQNRRAYEKRKQKLLGK